jgi:hypothetical protein
MTAPDQGAGKLRQTKVKFVALSVSVNQRTLIQILAKPRDRQQKGAL